MPTIMVNDASLFYRDEGAGDEVVVFSHSYLASHQHFDAQIEALKDRFRVIAYDHRGHGQSSVQGPATMEHIYRDGLGLLDALDIASCHWVGLSTGGFVGMRLAIREPHRLKSLVLCDTSADREPLLTRTRHTVSFGILRVLGYKPVMGIVMRAMFGPSFLADPDREAERELWQKRFESNDIPAMIRFGMGIFARKSVYEQLSEVELPTLVVVGDEDSATPPAKAERIARRIKGARLEVIARAGHLSTVVQPELVTTVLTEFLEEQRGR
jgi:pimeloyl-ACP methyl ester carboxylesterase